MTPIVYENGDHYATMRTGYDAQYLQYDEKRRTRPRQLLWWNKPLVGAKWVNCPACGERRIFGPTQHADCKNKVTAVRPKEPWLRKVRDWLVRFPRILRLLSGGRKQALRAAEDVQGKT